MLAAKLKCGYIYMDELSLRKEDRYKISRRLKSLLASKLKRAPC